MTTPTTTQPDTARKFTAAMELPTASAPVYTTILDTDLGPILLTSDGVHLTGLYLEVSEAIDARLDRMFGVEPTPEDDLEIFHRAEAQLGEYLSGQRTQFDLPLAAKGTEFQRSVWQALTQIPFGKARCGACCGGCQRKEPHQHHRALPPSHRSGRIPDRLRMGRGKETHLAHPGNPPLITT